LHETPSRGGGREKITMRSRQSLHNARYGRQPSPCADCSHNARYVKARPLLAWQDDPTRTTSRKFAEGTGRQGRALGAGDRAPGAGRARCMGLWRAALPRTATWAGRGGYQRDPEGHLITLGRGRRDSARDPNNPQGNGKASRVGGRDQYRSRRRAE